MQLPLQGARGRARTNPRVPLRLPWAMRRLGLQPAVVPIGGTASPLHKPLDATRGRVVLLHMPSLLVTCSKIR